jgi:tRNA (mo5U34)-methyltransferase
LGNGIVTPGYDRSLEKLKKLGFPEDFSGKTVLDVGAWDGFFSFEAERRGATRVLATDSFAWGIEKGSKEGFNLARKVLDSKVEDMGLDVLNLSPEKIGTFDVVFMLGVLYHMRHPMLALERVSSVTGDHLILETLSDLVNIRRPAMAFYPGTELNKDKSNWVGPNPAAVVGMLKAVGFKTVKLQSAVPSIFYRLARAIHHRVKHQDPLFPAIRQCRMVYHAWK